MDETIEEEEEERERKRDTPPIGTLEATAGPMVSTQSEQNTEAIIAPECKLATRRRPWATTIWADQHGSQKTATTTNNKLISGSDVIDMNRGNGQK